MHRCYPLVPRDFCERVGRVPCLRRTAWHNANACELRGHCVAVKRKVQDRWRSLTSIEQQYRRLAETGGMGQHQLRYQQALCVKRHLAEEVSLAEEFLYRFATTMNNRK